jgi:hypothetical protein
VGDALAIDPVPRQQRAADVRTSCGGGELIAVTRDCQQQPYDDALAHAGESPSAELEP